MAEVQVWRSQLAANDFPPVCAMTGAQAETWRKFTFTTTPAWAFLFGAIGAAAFSTRATGYLPLTRASSMRITRLRWGFGATIGLAFLLFFAGIFVAPSNDSDTTRNAIALVLFGLGTLALVGGLIGLVVARNGYGPGARIVERSGYHEPLLVLRRVHPAFVAAVQQHQQARAAQLQAMQAQQPPSPPPPPESPFPPGKYSF